MKIKEINNFSDFLSLKEEWASLLKNCDHTIFSTWEWLSTWWKCFGRNKKLLILLAEDKNKIIGIAPFMYIVNKTFGLTTRKIEFIGTPQSDYNNFIIAEKEEECLASFMHYITTIEEPWDYIELKEIPENTIVHFQKRPDNIKIAKAQLLHKCPYLILPKNVDVLVKGLNAKFRKNLKRSQKLIEMEHKLEFVDYSHPQFFKEGMKQLFELHQKRWESRGERGVFAREEIRNFHMQIAERFSTLGWLGLYSILADDKAIACLYGFKYRSKFYFYLSGIDPTYGKYSPGNLLILFVLQKCIKEGLTEFDFLRGDEPYKCRWASLYRNNFTLTLIKRGFLPSLRNKLTRIYFFQAYLLRKLLGK
ncbi:MAG: GNAT family N-acetyltransferase [Candidatus Aenigmatarchaeota archaeon]